MDKLELQKLRDLPIEQVAERLGLQLVRHKALCPFHDDHHASLSFCLRKNSFRCFVCGAHGGTIDLVMRTQGLNFREACQWLASNTSIPITPTQEKRPTVSGKPHSFEPARYEKYFNDIYWSPEARRFLFEERQLNPAVISWLRITSWCDRQGVHWLQIPYYDQHHQLIGIQNRRLSTCPKDNAAPRFRFPSGSRCGIYNLPILSHLKPDDELYITEGSSDCWAMLSAGKKAIAIPSATLLSVHDKQLLTNLRATSTLTFHIYPDADIPGERLFLQLRELLPGIQRHQLPHGCKDYADLYVKEIRNKK